MDFTQLKKDPDNKSGLEELKEMIENDPEIKKVKEQTITITADRLAEACSKAMIKSGSLDSFESFMKMSKFSLDIYVELFKNEKKEEKE